MSSIQRLLFLITYLIRFAIRQWKLKVWRSNAEDPIGSYQVTPEKSQIVYCCSKEIGTISCEEFSLVRKRNQRGLDLANMEGEVEILNGWK
jgi:hypothetical protein